MILDSKLVICAVASIVAHVAIARALELLPEDKTPPPKPRKIDVRIVPAPEVPPPPEPPKPPEPPPPPPKDAVEPPKKVVHAPPVSCTVRGSSSFQPSASLHLRALLFSSTSPEHSWPVITEPSSAT